VTATDAGPDTTSYLEGPYEEYIHAAHYARWRDDLGRREVWPESVDRYVEFVSGLAARAPIPFVLRDEERQLITETLLRQGSMCSMRALMTAGPAAERDNAALFNCCAVAIDHPRAFDETMYLLMCGCGVGFSVERQFIARLPEVPDRLFESDDVIVVGDSRKRWASAFRRLLASLWAGHVPRWDLSQLRPAGARLKTFGGRSSGPAPLEELFRHAVALFRGATGRRLTSLECHSLMCKVGEIVVSGGVRRSALISLSNPSDERMRDAKSGDWRRTHPHFELANNSAVWTEKPDPGRFMREWLALYESKSGERGIINRRALQRQAERTGRRDHEQAFLVNPCVEIALRNCEMCNLTEVVARADDDLKSLISKARVAAIMGTLQSLATDFAYLRPIWRENCEEERLLGVSVTGQMDHPVLSAQTAESAEWWRLMREAVLETNAEWAGWLGIPRSAATTCQKPSGTVSQLVNSASGGHARFAPYYVRRTRESLNDPVTQLLREAGVPNEPSSRDPNTIVFEWPIKAPDGAITTEDQSAIDQLERWLHVRTHWTEHNPSATIEVKESEWPSVGAWVYEHFDEIGGLAFLPADEGAHEYTQMPYEKITEEEYRARLAKMPATIDWARLGELETEDQTSSSRELACSAGQCEVL
jgi:ribonucleoside-triphosphate reductase